MTRRYVHYIDATGLSVFLSDAGRTKLLARFTNDEQGFEDFSGWTEKHLSGVHALLVDLPDEGYQVESIPYVTRTDRAALVSRKLSQLFLGSPYSTAISLGREKSGRRDEQVLFTAITRPASIEPWMRPLRLHGAAVSTICSAPLLSKRLLESMDGIVDDNRGLLITFTPAGIRQTFFVSGQLRFSRLSPAPEGSFAEWGPACLREAQKTWQYLTAQRWVQRSDRLKAWVLVGKTESDPVFEALGGASLDSLSFRAVNLASIAQRCGVRDPIVNSDSTPLVVNLAARNVRGIQLAMPSDRQVFKVGQSCKVAAITGVFASIAVALLGVKFLVDADNLVNDTQELKVQKAELDSRYRALVGSFPAMPTSLEALQAVVAEQASLGTRRSSLQEMLAPLSSVLDRYPDVEVRRIEWQQEASTPEKINAVADEKATTARGITLLNAALPIAAASDPSTSLTRIRQFAEEVRRSKPGSDVALVHMPFDVEPNQTLHSDSVMPTRAPEFQLRWTAAMGVQR